MLHPHHALRIIPPLFRPGVKRRFVLQIRQVNHYRCRVGGGLKAQEGVPGHVLDGEEGAVGGEDEVQVAVGDEDAVGGLDDAREDALDRVEGGFACEFGTA